MHAAQCGLTLLPPDEPYWRQSAQLALAWAHLLEGNPNQALDVVFGDQEFDGDRTRGQPSSIGSAFVLAEVSRMRGDLHRAMDLCNEVLRLAGEPTGDQSRDGPGEPGPASGSPNPELVAARMHRRLPARRARLAGRASSDDALGQHWLDARALPGA